MMLRIPAFILTLGLACGAHAQQAGFLYFEAQQPITQQQLKLLMEGIQTLDATAEVFHSDDYRIVQVKSANLQPEAIYRAFLETRGVALRPGTRTPEELGINNRPAVPVYVATGDAAADRARYRAAVEQWNALHPDQPYSVNPVHER